MNSVTGLVKPECRIMLARKRFFAMQARRKKQPKSCKMNSLFKVLNVKSNSERNQAAKYNPQRVNEFNIQMLSECLYKHLYNNKVQNKTNSALLEKARKKLEKYGLGTSVNYQNDVQLTLPELKGEIDKHFWSIGNEQSKPYRDLLEEFIAANLPNPPKVWVCQPGWTKYTENDEPVQVQYPDEDAFVLDIEVCVKLGHAPTLATAVSSKAWYGWVSPVVVEETKHFQPSNLEFLIPLVKVDKPSIVVGHSVSYDRAYIKEEYNINTTGRKFLDTMALHISIGKFTSKRHLFVSYITLKELYQLYCDKVLDKDKRSIFLTGELLDIKTDFQDLMAYCAKDTRATYEVLQVIFPKFLQHFPHPVTLAGMLEMSIPYLPVNHNWRQYVKSCNEAHDDLKSEMLALITRKMDDTCRLLHNNEYRNDLWMWGENWKTQKLKLTKKKKKITPKTDVENFNDEEERDLHDKFKYLFDLEERLPKKKFPFLPGYPLWYRQLRNKTDSVQVSPGKLIMPKILRIKWENFPLHYVTRFGWGILIPDVNAKDINTSVPFERLKALTIKNLNLEPGKPDGVKSVEGYYKGEGLWCNGVIDNCCYFYKLRKDNFEGKNVRTIFSKHFTLSVATLSSEDATTKRVLAISEKTAFWEERKSLINKEMVIWLDEERGVILPRVIVCGTITRRASERLWLDSIPENAVGSELRSMVQAPAGYHIVGGHVDLDLWIASLLGDSANLKIHGSTPLGWVTLNGIDRSVNSVLAKFCNLPLRQAELLTSCRLRGSGVLTTEKQLKRLNPNMTLAEAKRLARKIYSLTKGVKLCRMKHSKKLYFIKQAKQLCETRRKVFEDLFLKPFWCGGMESYAHNKLENLVDNQCPTTPFLSSRLCEALDEKFMHSKKFGSMVQSSGVDFLHLMLVCMRWLTNGKARYCFSFHNEVRYLIPSKDRYNGALALHISNLLVKAYCSHKVGMDDLPLSTAFFPTVGVDTTLRKEVCNEYVTPSNPHGLEKGCGIAPGEELDIYSAIEKTGGSLKAFSKKTKL